MKCTNNLLYKKFICGIMISLMVFTLPSCGNSSYELPFEGNSKVSGFNIITEQKSDVIPLFASDLCISDKQVTDPDFANTEDCGTAILFDVMNSEVLYSSHAHEQMSPASLTKVLMALVALKNATPDTVLTASEQIFINEQGAQLCGLKPGDTMTLNQALYIALLHSANDAALLIAQNIGGSEEGFVEMMNQEAQRLGATNSNFVNPHGLTDSNQYTTAYDLYLIFNEAIKYEKFVEIIQTPTYETIYYDRNGKEVPISVRNTNKYINSDVKAPENVKIIGGKTGTTNAAGHCLMVLAKDKNGAPYISVILKAGSRDSLYAQMTDLLEEITK
ncbi:MAG: D-alanyl-D-alanine carboxypeptidase [Lachnospiraceae bacterium]|nr:D-alanyl-D-alanine carboxypeptidase [Lachnospiraceae bacterium]MBR4085242.1 D-alanyl-D-alanine carboxypeptidase [Lachnospiraceae bacterium]